MSQEDFRLLIAQLNITNNGLEVISKVVRPDAFILLIGDILTLDFQEVGARVKISFEKFEVKPGG